MSAQVDQDIDLSAIVDQVIPRAERETGCGPARMMPTPARYAIGRTAQISCHLFTCVVAMAYLRRIKLKTAMAGLHRSATTVIEDMWQLHHVLQRKERQAQPRAAPEDADEDPA